VQSFTAHMPLLTATSAFRLGRRRWSSPQQCYLHCLRTITSRNVCDQCVGVCACVCVCVCVCVSVCVPGASGQQACVR